MGNLYCCYTVRPEMGEKLDQARGKAKTVAGATTGNERLEAEGHLDQAKGKAKSALKARRGALRRRRVSSYRHSG